MTLSCRNLLENHRKINYEKDIHKIVFKGVSSKDIYNITAPFLDNGIETLSGRVEDRNNELSQVMFFQKRNDVWCHVLNSPVFNLQDPFFTKIKDDLIIGGVQISPYIADVTSNQVDKEKLYSWRTVLYKGKNIFNLKLFFIGPDDMKDLRIVELKSGEIGVFSRPQGIKGGKGKIGFTKVDTLDYLSIGIINNASLIKDLFSDSEWGGTNAVYPLFDEYVGVLGHIACFDEDKNRHYYSMSFIFNTETFKYSDVKILAERSDFLPGKSKRPELNDIVFSGGIVFNDKKAYLYTGVSDAESQLIEINNPFINFMENYKKGSFL